MTQFEEMYRAILAMPVIDVHSHLKPGALCAESLDSVLSYHILRYVMRAAGIPEKELWPDSSQIHAGAASWDHFLSAWPFVQNTGFGWILKRIIRNLYGCKDPIHASCREHLEELFTRHTQDPGWIDSIRERAHIETILTSAAQKIDPATLPDDIQPTLEHSPVMRIREFVSWKDTFSRMQELTGSYPSTRDELRDDITTYIDSLDWRGKRAFVSWVSTITDFSPVDSDLVDSILKKALATDTLPPDEEAILSGVTIHDICRAVTRHVPVCQLVYGMQFIADSHPHPLLRSRDSFINSLGYLIDANPGLHFNILNGCENDEPALCSLCLAYGNVSLASFWWNMFYPTVMKRAWHRRLEMLPTSRLCAFFSDGWCIDWVYGRLRLTQRVLAEVFSEKVSAGYLTFDTATTMAHQILYDTPRQLFSL